ncbi:MAG: proton-conducting transporter membrane subunit [bacterium]
MINNILIAPVLIPLLGGALLVALRPPERVKHWITGISVTFVLISIMLIGRFVHAVGGIATLQFGNWLPPFGIVFAVDWLSVFMLSFLNLIGFCVVIYSFFKSVRGSNESPYFYALILFQIAGVNGALTTGDIFNLFVWYEVMLIVSYGLLAQGGYRRKIKGVPDYIVINIFSGLLFLLAVAITYASFGTLNMAHIGQLVKMGEAPPWSTTLAMIYFVVFGTKAAVFPLYFWLFRGYPLASAPVAALFGGLLTKVGVYSMLRVFPLMFPEQFLAGEVSFTRMVFYLVGSASIIFGVAGALSRHEWKDILSHHITSQIGYMIIGIGVWTTGAVAGTLYYIVQHTVVKSSLFLIGGMTEDHMGTTDLGDQSGLIEQLPYVATLFLIAGLALAGLPPLSGFFAKMTIFYSAFVVGGQWAYAVIAAGLVGGLFTLYSMVKIWRLSFLGEPSEDTATGAPGIRKGLFVGPSILVITSICLGLFGGTVYGWTSKAAEQVLNPQPYIEKVMSDSPVYGQKPGEYEPETHTTEKKRKSGNGHH